MSKVVILGPGQGFKTGIATFTISMARAFAKMENMEVHILSWTRMYPYFIPKTFIDDKSQVDILKQSGVESHYLLNYNNPLSWKKTYKKIAELKPDLLIIQWFNPVQAHPIQYIIHHLKVQMDIKIWIDVHFGNRHDYGKTVRMLNHHALQYADGYITHSFTTACEIKEIFPEQNFIISDGQDELLCPHESLPILKLFHPIYDIYSPKADFQIEEFKQRMGLKKYVFLFFGFIIKYKGLHHALKAFAELVKERDDVSLLIAGESSWQQQKGWRHWLSRNIRNYFYNIHEDEKDYKPLKLIKEFGIEDSVCLINEFIPTEEVYQYFQASNALLLFYESETASGVESIAYNFNLPILASATNHFRETIRDGITGYIANDYNPQTIKDVMQAAIETPLQIKDIEEHAKAMSWDKYVARIWHCANTPKITPTDEANEQ